VVGVGEIATLLRADHVNSVAITGEEEV
jgi:hypothetical protein